MSKSSSEFQAGRTRSRFDGNRNPEEGIFARIREWNDVFPWFRLGRVLRIAGSPPLVLLTFLSLGVWWLGQSWILGDFLANQQSGPSSPWEIGVGYRPLASFSRIAYLTSPSTIYSAPTRPLGWRLLVGTGWSLLIWTPLALLLIRQGALLTAGRPMMSLRSGLRLAFARMLRAHVAALVPTVCLALIALLVFAVGKLSQWVESLTALNFVLAVLVAVISLLCGLLAFGSHFAIPLGWAALAVEQSPDPLDSLSRGYEYLFRRPLQLAGYLILCLGIVLLIGLFASGVASAASTVVEGVLSLGESAPLTVRRVAIVLAWFPVAMVVTLGWGLLGGIYLLLRRDAGGQEVEDIWMPPVETLPPLPSLPSSP